MLVKEAPSVILPSREGGLNLTNNIIDVVFIRHAEPDYTEPDDYKRDLTSTGKEQANNLVQEFKYMKIARIYSSPFLRAISTLRPLSKERGLPIYVIDELRERKSAGYSCLLYTSPSPRDTR